MAQARVPAGTPAQGRIHPGEFAARAKRRTGRAGAPVPRSAPLHNPVHETGPSAADREKSRVEHESRLPEEMGGTFECQNCGWAGWREHPVMTKEGKMHATLAFQGCSRCGTMHVSHVGVAGVHSPQHTTARQEKIKPSRPEPPASTGGRRVRKSVDTSETALARQDLEGLTYVGHRKNCPAGGDSPCGAAVDGACGLCQAPVRDHETISKTRATVLELRTLAGLN